jgi:nitrate reductase beta subunit
LGEHQPTARPRSLVSGKRMEKIEWGPNWEEILGTEFAKRRKDKNFDQIQADIYGEYENTFMMYLPRLCEHCLNPACAASCPSGAIYKREEDGIVLIDQDKCRGWRMCISGCPYKKIYFNWKSGKSEKCIFCYPRIEAGMPTVCSKPAWAGSATSACCCTTPTASAKWPARQRAGPVREAAGNLPRPE